MLQKHLLFFVAILVFSLLSVGCRQEPNPGSTVEEGGSVFFNIELVTSIQSNDGEIKTWIASHEGGGKKARFRIELTLKEPKADVPFAFSRGAIYHESDSDPSVLLSALAKALGAKHFVAPQAMTNKLTFVTAILGQQLSRGRGTDVLAGGFTSNPKGDWLAIKYSYLREKKMGNFS